LQLVFARTIATIVSGAMAERTRLGLRVVLAQCVTSATDDAA
jgi:ammonia channel protein AmtB